MPFLIPDFRNTCCLALFSIFFGITYSQAATLPSPLTLPQALQIATQNHPVLSASEARIERAQAQVLVAKANAGFDINLQLDAKRVEKSTSDLFIDDGSVNISARHVLFDFGVNSASIDRYQYRVNAQSKLHDITLIQQLLATERAYYDVLLSDLRYAADNENMTVAYLKYDKIKQRHELGIYSDLELAAAESQYRKLLNIRKNAEIQQRIRRQKLAMLLNQLNDVPADLIMPKLIYLNKKSPDVEIFYQRCLTRNPLLLSLQASIRANRSAITAEKKLALPVITAELGLHKYQRELDSRNKMEIGLQLNLPLYQSGLLKAKTRRATATLRETSAQLQLAKLQLQQNILELALKLDALQVAKKSVELELDFRELDIDKRRAEYELEQQTNMGSAMANLSLSQWQAAKINFDIELSWKKLYALMGTPPNKTPKSISP